jgi:hypothetical protein
MTTEFDYETAQSAQVALTSTGDKFTFTPCHPVDLIGFGIIGDALIDVGAGMTVKVDKRPTAGSDSGRGDGDIGSIVRGTDADIAAGKGLFTRFTTPKELNPGEQAVVEVTNAADTAGTGIVFLRYRKRPAAGSRWTGNITEV